MGPWAYELIQTILGGAGITVADCFSVVAAVVIVVVLGAVMGFFRRK